MNEVRVSLGERSYSIHIGNGILHTIGENMNAFSFSRKTLVISDTNVAPLYLDTVVNSLQEAGFVPYTAIVEAGEKSKAFATAEQLFTTCIEAGLDRKSPIIALGGGVIGDLAGFVAATYLRGVPFIQIPTSLLAQVDSSVGGKVAVNHPLGKNLIGAFYQPKFVLIDTDTLTTLPPRELSTGLAEVIKYGLIADNSLFTYLSSHSEEVLSLEPDAIRHLVTRSCEIKANVVERDEKESSLRMILNFGHTAAHAIEANTGYRLYNHGEAVAVGMVAAARISKDCGYLDNEAVRVIEEQIEQYRLPLTASDCTEQELYDLLYHDKKMIGGKLNWVLLTKIGETKIRSDIKEEIIHHALASILADCVK